MARKYGKLCTAAQAGMKVLRPGWKVEVVPPDEPTVYICSHHNMQGPITTVAFFPFHIRAWVLHVFFDRDACYRQYADYTFTARFGMPKWLGSALAKIVSGAVSTLMHSIDAIPVYRGTSKIMATFRESLDTLKEGENIIIFPDIAYSEEEAGIGSIYEGFLMLEKNWRRTQGTNLRFVPLYVDESRKVVVEGAEIRFDPDKAFKEDMPRVSAAIRDSINQMAEQAQKTSK